MPIKNIPITADTPKEDLINYAIVEVKNLLPSDKPFMVRDLFLGYEWNRLSNYTRASIGTGVFQFAQGDGKDLLTALNKTARNQQLYSRNDTKV